MEAITMSEEKKEIVETAEPKKWTFLNYIKGVARYKWWVIGFTVFGVLAGFLGFKFVLSPATTKLTATYTYELAGEYENLDTVRLVDGSSFNPFTVTSESVLNAVKEANPETYAKVDVKKIVKKNGISISKDVETVGQKENEVAYVTYTMSASASLFPSQAVGQQFIYDVITYPAKISAAAADNYSVEECFTSNFGELLFKRQIDQMAEQYKAISDTYKQLGKDFDKSSVADENGSKIYDLENKFESNYSASSLKSFSDELYSQLFSRHYVNYVEGHEEEKIAEIRALCKGYLITLQDKIAEKDALEKQVEQLKWNYINLTDKTSEYLDQITELTEQITIVKADIQGIERELENHGYRKIADEWVDKSAPDGSDTSSPTDLGWDGCTINCLMKKEAAWAQGSKDFATTITSYKTKLDADKNIASAAFRYCYKAYHSNVYILGSGFVRVKGSISSSIGAVVGLLAFYAASSFIVAAVYIYKKEQ